MVDIMSQPLNPDGRTWIPTEYEAGCAEEPGRDNILPLPGFELQTIQPIASRYTDYANLVPKYKPYNSYSVAPSEYFSEARELKECF